MKAPKENILHQNLMNQQVYNKYQIDKMPNICANIIRKKDHKKKLLHNNKIYVKIKVIRKLHKWHHKLYMIL